MHFSRFHPQHKLAHLTPTPVETLVKARDAARAEGLRYVYIGNVPGLEGAETTWCPNCKKAIVERDIFAVTRMDITGRQMPFLRDEDRRGVGIRRISSERFLFHSKNGFAVNLYPGQSVPLSTRRLWMAEEFKATFQAQT